MTFRASFVDRDPPSGAAVHRPAGFGAMAESGDDRPGPAV